jgi:hypothetical protein
MNTKPSMDAMMDDINMMDGWVEIDSPHAFLDELKIQASWSGWLTHQQVSLSSFTGAK